MKKYLFLIAIIISVSGCTFKTNEEILGYNDKGETMVQDCTDIYVVAFGTKSCKIETRNYGKISNKSNTVNVISNDNR